MKTKDENIESPIKNKSINVIVKKNCVADFVKYKGIRIGKKKAVIVSENIKKNKRQFSCLEIVK